jgi:hypothetical protein
MTAMRNPVDLTRGPADLAQALGKEGRARARTAIFNATGELYRLVRDNAIGSGEVVEIEWDTLRLVGPVEQNGHLVNQNGYIVVNVMPDPTPEFRRISHGIWGDYLAAFDAADRERQP